MACASLPHAISPSGTVSGFQALVGTLSAYDNVLVVGHNPNLSEFLGRTISENGCEAGTDLKKGAVAKVEMGRNSALLNWSVTPKVLRSLYSAAAESSRPKTSRK